MIIYVFGCFLSLQISQANDWATNDTATLLHSLMSTNDPIEATRGLREQLCRGMM